MSELLPGTSRSEVAVEGVRFALHRAEPAGTPAGRPVLLLHGVPETSASWASVLPELATDRVVLAPDLKGLGRSEMRGPYDVATLAREMAALVLHEVDGPVDVVGHDWGGVIALALAESRPDLVGRLVIINAPYRRLDVFHAWHIPLAALPGVPELVLRAAAGSFVRRAFDYCWKSDTPPSAALLAHYEAAYASAARQEAMLGYYRAAARPRAAAAVAGLVAKVRGLSATVVEPPQAAARTLVLWGAADPVLPVAVGENVVRDLGPDTVMVTVPGAGHFPHEEAPGIAVPVIARFLREGDDDTGPAEDPAEAAEGEPAEKAAPARKAPAAKGAAAKKTPATRAAPAKRAPAKKAAPAASGTGTRKAPARTVKAGPVKSVKAAPPARRGAVDSVLPDADPESPPTP